MNFKRLKVSLTKKEKYTKIELEYDGETIIPLVKNEDVDKFIKTLYIFDKIEEYDSIRYFILHRKQILRKEKIKRLI